MKRNHRQMWRTVIALILTFTLVFGTASTAFATMNSGVTPNGETSESKETIKYVSLGDSMTNGYGFTGYNQDMHTVDRDEEHLNPEDYNYFDGTGVYGEGSYANQFAEYLESEGYNVDHSKLALSAFRPEDMLFLIDDSINKYDWSKLPLKDGYFNNSWSYVWASCEDFDAQNSNTTYRVDGSKSSPHLAGLYFCHEPGTSCGATGYVALNVKFNNSGYYTRGTGVKDLYDAQFNELKTYFQDSLTEADVISLALGNAAFDAYFMDRLFMVWGPDSDWTNGRNEIKIADVKEQLCETEAERAFVDKLYEVMKSVVADYISAEDYSAMQMDRVCQLMTYVAFSYMNCYKDIIEWIGENNSDAKVMIVGLLNSHYGITMTQDGEALMDMGEGMGALYELMDTYVAGVAADYMAKNDNFTGNFLFVEQPENPEMIATKVGALDQAGWGLIDCGKADCEYCLNGEACPDGRLDGKIVREKTIPVFTSFFAKGLGYWYPGAQYAGGLANSDQELLTAIQNAIDNDLDAVEFYNSVTSGSYTSNSFNNNNVGPIGTIVANVLYLACEKAMVEALESGELEVSALVGYADGSMKKLLNAVDKTILPTNKAGQTGWADVNVPTHDANGKEITLKYIYDYFYEFYTSEEMLPMLRFFAINKVGNGIAAHPTPSNHDRLAANVIAAYEDGYTVQDKCADDPDMIVVNEIYYALSEAGLLTSEQTNTIIDYFVDVMLGEKSSDGAVDYIYDMMLRDESRTAEEKIQIIGIIYNAVNEAGYLNDYAKAFGAIEEIYTYLDSKDYISDEQSFAIVDCVYNALMNDGEVSDKEVKSIALFIYNKLTGTKEAVPIARLARSSSGMSVEQKVEVINKVYDVLKDKGYLDDADQVEDIKAIFDIVEAESPETAVEVFEIAFYGMMESDELTEEKQAEIIDDVYTVVMKSDKLSSETKMTIVEKVTALVGGNATDLPEKPEVVINALRQELTASGYFTDEQIVEIINIVYDLVTSTSDDEKVELVEKLHNNILGREDLSVEEKIEIITITYNVLDQYGYVDYAIALIYEYYDEAYEYAYDYALEEGYIDEAVKGIDTAIEAMETAKAELETIESDMTDEFRAEVLKEIDEIIDTLEEAKALILEADVLDQASLDALMALLNEAGEDMTQLGEIFAQAGIDTYELVILPACDVFINEVVPQINKQLQIAVDKAIEWLIEEVYPAFMEWLINEALPGVDKALYDWFYENPETVIGFFIEYGDELKAITDKYGDEAVAVLGYVLYTYGPDAVEYAIENPEEAIAKWVEWYNKHGHKVWPMIDKYLETLDEMGAFDGLKAAAAELEAYVIEYAEKVVEQLEAKIDELNDAAQAALEDLKAAIEAVDVDAILAALEELYDAGVAIYEGATTGYYAATEDSYYVALGDTDVEYAEIVAAELDLDKDQFVNAGIDGMRAEDLRMILDADYEGDAYGKANFGDVADLREELTAEIEKADLITLGFNNNTITEFTANQIAAMMAGEEAAAMDWAEYIGKDGAAAMEDAIAEIKAALVAEGVDAESIDLVVTAVESYAYACTGFACNYPEAINEIKAINPDAQVVVVGMYNPFENAVLDIEGTEIPVGDFVGALVDLANVHYTSYAILTGNAVYVHAPAVETKTTFEEAMGIEGFVSVLTDLDSLEPTAAGHEYIAEQIIDAMNVVSKAVYDAQKLIDQIKAFGEVTRDNLADAKALAEAARAAYDKLTDAEKELIGLDNYKVLVDFELAVAKVELGVAEDIAAAEKALAEAEAKAAEIERALKITESTVTNLKAKVVNKAQIKVTWTADETTPDQYRVTLMRDGKKAGTYWVKGEKSSVTLKNILRGTNFTVRVTPVAKVDGQKYFSIYKTSNKVKTQLQKANLTVKKAGLKKQIISKDQNSTGFQIYISKDKKFKKDVKKLVYKTNKKGLNVKVKAKNFKKGTNYVKVRAYTKVNGKTTYGAWSGTVKVTK